MNRISVLAIVSAVAMMNVGCDEAPTKRQIAKLPKSTQIQSFAAFDKTAAPKDDCNSVPDDETESGLNLHCGGEFWILMWDENKDGSYVKGSAQVCCLDEKNPQD